MADKMRLGFVGANVRSTWASQSHFPALLASPDVELTAVCTTRPESAEEARRWRYALDPAGCWSLTSGDRHAPHTSQLSCPATTGAHGCRWSPLRCARHGRHNAVTAGPRETAARR